MGDIIPLLIIGKPENRRQMKRLKNVWFTYYINDTAWVTEQIFFDYCLKLNNEFVKKKSILLFIDNCKAHPNNLSFSNLKIIFLPAYTTSVLQPMDAGVIKCCKIYYRQEWLAFSLI